MFLIDVDYKAFIDDEDLLVITNASTIQRGKAEAAGIEEMLGYLRAKYDTALILINVREWNAATTYNIGDHVFFDDGNGDVVYRALAGNTNKQPDLNPAEWDIGDDRNPALLMFLVDLVVYHLHTSINPRNIPELRGIRYDRAIKWFTQVRDGILETTLPRLEANEGQIIIHNSKPKLRNDW